MEEYFKVSEELTILREYFEDLRLDIYNLTKEDMTKLETALRAGGEKALANWLSNLNDPEDLLDYLGE